MSAHPYDADIQRLLEILGMPKDCREFEVRFAVNEPVTAKATFYVPDLETGEAEAITKHYKLVEQESVQSIKDRCPG